MTTCIDVAGAREGGAARLLVELDGYARGQQSPPRIIGRDVPVTLGWLARRELRTGPAKIVVATNNVSYMGGRRHRRVLLRNALHFLIESELHDGVPRSKSLIAQTQVVRAAVRRADLVVVPCTAMADRVLTAVPSLANRLVVRHHPVSPVDRSACGHAGQPTILVPVLMAPYKRIENHIESFLAATRESGTTLQVALTATSDELSPAIGAQPNLTLLGRLDAAELAQHWRSCDAIYFPMSIESFGYPLAEARANGIPVIAHDTAQNREIAGAALHGYTPNDAESLLSAVQTAITAVTEPDPAPFDPVSYFDWLLSENPR